MGELSENAVYRSGPVSDMPTNRQLELLNATPSGEICRVRHALNRGGQPVPFSVPLAVYFSGVTV